MTPAPPQPRRRAWNPALGALAAVLLLVAAAVLLNRPSGEEEPPPTGEPTTATPTEAEPLEVSESTTLTVPDTQRLESYSFEAEAGSTYLLRFEATTRKPQGSPGDAMYFGSSLACGGPTESTMRSVGATQNVRTGEAVSLRNQFLLEIEEDGEYACRLLVFSPNAEVAAAGTTAHIEARWSATRAEAGAVEASAGEHLPRLVEPTADAAAFVQEMDLSAQESRELNILGTVHVTTCTEEEGSSEDGRTWCLEDDVDRDGSAVTVTYRLEAVGSDEEVCEIREVNVARAQVDRHSHHQIFHVNEHPVLPQELCGTSARLAVSVENDGPAPLLVHRASSTLVILPG